MKCIKLTYRSPVFGSVVCEDLPEEYVRHIDFGPETASLLFDKGPEVELFLTEQIEDLTFAVPEELKKLVLKAVFGEYDFDDDGAYMKTEIYAAQEPTDEEHKLIIDWISGQMSDGWGEGVEQKAAYTERVEWESSEFDPYTCTFETNLCYADAHYYLHPWTRDPRWRVTLGDYESAELDIEPDAECEKLIENIRRLEEVKAELLKLKGIVDEIIEDLKTQA